MENRETVIKKLRDSGLKVTPQRVAIIEFLDGNKTHPAAEEIFSHVKNSHPGISFGTVYNTLEALVKINEIREVSFSTKRKHFDPDTSDHHHIVCTSCSKITDVFADFKDNLKLPGSMGGMFKVTGSSVCFTGLCSDCK